MAAVRRATVPDAVVDENLFFLSVPPSLFLLLGLDVPSPRTPGTLPPVVRVSLLGREGTTEVVALPDEGPVRVGRAVLTLLDLVADPISGRLTGNPAHGGVEMSDLFAEVR